MSETNLKRKLRIGYIVFCFLVVIKIVEYTISTKVHIGNWPYMLVLALVSACLIVYFYKHISQLWHSKDR
jgi:hypothetical protein